MRSIFLELGLKELLEKRNYFLITMIVDINEKVIITELEGNFIVFVNEKKYLGPMSIAIQSINDFRELGLKLDDRVKFQDKKLYFGNEIVIDISNYQVVDLRFDDRYKRLCEETIKKNLFHIEEFLYRCGKRNGIMPIIFNLGEYISEFKTVSNLNMHNNMYTSLIYTRMISLFEKLIKGRFEKIEYCIRDIIEIGTENNEYSSGFLLGIMTCIIYAAKAYGLDEEGAIKLNRYFLNGLDISNKENIYTTFLIEAADGGSPKILKNIVNSIVSENNIEVLDEKLKNLMRFDKIAGTDIICGIYMGMRLLEKEKFRISINNLCRV